MSALPHQYIARDTGKVITERLYQDRVVRFLYGAVREHMPAVFRMLTSRHSTRLLGYLNYDSRWGAKACSRFMQDSGIDLSECIENPAAFDTPRAVFERKIRYWSVRPMPEDPGIVVAPADARVLLGSFAEDRIAYVKDKFFEFDELLGREKTQWLRAFERGDYAIFRLTPEKYHYNHVPVSGIVRDVYEISGAYHSCNPSAVLELAQPHSKNRRVVTVIDTDVPGGTGVGKVAMIEVVALMIGEIRQCYSESRYVDPRPVVEGMWLRRGCPKSLFRPGSSTTILVLERGRARFASDIVANQRRVGVHSRYSAHWQRPLIETDVRLCSAVATRQYSYEALQPRGLKS